jgi:hypothetical protein
LLQEKTNWKPIHTMKDSMKEIVNFYMDKKWLKWLRLLLTGNLK